MEDRLEARRGRLRHSIFIARLTMSPYIAESHPGSILLGMAMSGMQARLLYNCTLSKQ
jgi:hypothetical protein